MLKYRVKSTTNVKSLAGSITLTLKENKTESIVLQCCGAGALNQAIKAVTVAKGFLATNGVYDIVVRTAFDEIILNDEPKTIINLLVSLN